MKQTSCVSRTFFRRPNIQTLPPLSRLVLALLIIGCESHVGCWIPSALAEDSALPATVVTDCLDELKSIGEIIRDERTGEIFLTSFFRYNTFKTAPRWRQAVGDYQRIESKNLREAILLSITTNTACGLPESFPDLTGR